MKNLTSKLIRLGHTNPELRNNLRPILDTLTGKTSALKLNPIMERLAKDLVEEYTEEAADLLEAYGRVQGMSAGSYYHVDGLFSADLGYLMGTGFYPSSVSRQVEAADEKVFQEVQKHMKRRYPHLQLPIEYHELESQKMWEEATEFEDVERELQGSEDLVGSIGLSFTPDRRDPNVFEVTVHAGYKGEGRHMNFRHQDTFRKTMAVPSSLDRSERALVVKMLRKALDQAVKSMA